MASTVLPNGIIVPEKFSRDWYADLYHNWQELDNLLGGGTPKDGTLTIQKNGDTVGTFSANQSTDETVNIEVPTKTSDLTNDSGFITGVAWNDVTDKPSFATVATSGSYNDLSNKPTIPTVNDATLTIQQNSVTVDTFTANSSSDKTVNIQCVDLSSNQTIGGNKTFSKIALKSSRIERGSLPSSNVTEDCEIEIVDKSNRRILGIFNYYYTNGSGKTSFYAYNPNTTDYDNIAISFNFDNASNQKSLIPVVTSAIDLGTSTNKWKTINGINPGALSLPSRNYISIDTTGFDVTATIIGTFTPTVDGWAILSITQKNKHFGIWILWGSYRVTFHSVYHQGDYMIFALIPVTANLNLTIYCTADDIDSTRKVDWLRLFPCQGNV